MQKGNILRFCGSECEGRWRGWSSEGETEASLRHLRAHPTAAADVSVARLLAATLRETAPGPYADRCATDLETNWEAVSHLHSDAAAHAPRIATLLSPEHAAAVTSSASVEAWVAGRGRETMPAVEAVQRAMMAFSCNAFVARDGSGTETGTGLYLAVSLLNHACRPNATCEFDRDQITVRTLQPIPAGAAISIAYHDELRPPSPRRRSLFDQYRFHCVCALCLDPLAESCGRPVGAGAEAGAEVAGEKLFATARDRVQCALEAYDAASSTGDGGGGGDGDSAAAAAQQAAKLAATAAAVAPRAVVAEAGRLCAAASAAAASRGLKREAGVAAAAAWEAAAFALSPRHPLCGRLAMRAGVGLLQRGEHARAAKFLNMAVTALKTGSPNDALTHTAEEMAELVNELCGEEAEARRAAEEALQAADAAVAASEVRAAEARGGRR